MIVVKREVFYIGLGFCSVAALSTLALLWLHSRARIDLSKFDSPDIPGSGACMDKTFLNMLRQIEKKTGYPIFEWINSGARSPYWNTKVGGVINSAHKIPTCKAADIRTENSVVRDRIISAAKAAGIKRIGIGKTFVHLDNDTSKKQNVAWGYPAGSPPPYNPFTA